MSVRVSRDHNLFINSPKLIADFHALRRLLIPRHPPCALSNLTIGISNSSALQSTFPPITLRTRHRFPRLQISQRFSALLFGIYLSRLLLSRSFGNGILNETLRYHKNPISKHCVTRRTTLSLHNFRYGKPRFPYASQDAIYLSNHVVKDQISRLACLSTRGGGPHILKYSFQAVKANFVFLQFVFSVASPAFAG